MTTFIASSDNGSPQPRVLVANGDPTERALCVAMPSRAGFAVSEAADGERAWDLLQAERFNLVLTAHLMPKASGLALARRMRVAEMSCPLNLASQEQHIANQTIADRLTKS